jgi:hypothetical protein
MDEKTTTGERPRGGGRGDAGNAFHRERGADKTFRPAVLRLLIRLTVCAVFGLAVALAVMYCAGSLRGTPDREQFALVRLILTVSVLLWVSAFCGAIVDLWYGIAFKKAGPLAGTIGYLLLVLLGTVMAMGAGFILSIAGGNS